MKLSNLFKRSTPAPVQPSTTPQPQESNLLVVGEYGSESRVSVTGPEGAMKLAAVYRCTDILSGSIASIPLQLKVKKNGVFQYSESEPMNYYLNKVANPRQTSWDMMCNAVIQMVNAGNAYIYPEYRLGELKGLTLLSPGSVTHDPMLDHYLINDFVNNIYKSVSSADIIHLKNMSLDGGLSGVSTIKYASRVLSIGASSDERSLDSFQPGSSLKGFISGSGEVARGMGAVQDAQVETVADRVEKEISSGKKIFRVPGDMKFNPLSLSPADLQLLQTKDITAKDICRFYGVHPDKVFAGQSSNYKASEMSQVDFINDTLIPRIRKIEAEFNAKLIPREISSKYRIEFDLEAIYQTDLKSTAAYMKATIESGIYTPNEWRRRKGQAPVEGGDEPFVSANIAPLNSAKIRGESKSAPKNEVSPDIKKDLNT